MHLLNFINANSIKIGLMNLMHSNQPLSYFTKNFSSRLLMELFSLARLGIAENVEPSSVFSKVFTTKAP